MLTHFLVCVLCENLCAPSGEKKFNAKLNLYHRKIAFGLFDTETHKKSPKEINHLSFLYF